LLEVILLNLGEAFRRHAQAGHGLRQRTDLLGHRFDGIDRLADRGQTERACRIR